MPLCDVSSAEKGTVGATCSDWGRLIKLAIPLGQLQPVSHKHIPKSMPNQIRTVGPCLGVFKSTAVTHIVNSCEFQVMLEEVWLRNVNRRHLQWQLTSRQIRVRPWGEGASSWGTGTSGWVAVWLGQWGRVLRSPILSLKSQGVCSSDGLRVVLALCPLQP